VFFPKKWRGAFAILRSGFAKEARVVATVLRNGYHPLTEQCLPDQFFHDGVLRQSRHDRHNHFL